MQLEPHHIILALTGIIFILAVYVVKKGEGYRRALTPNQYDPSAMWMASSETTPSPSYEFAKTPGSFEVAPGYYTTMQRWTPGSFGRLVADMQDIQAKPSIKNLSV